MSASVSGGMSLNTGFLLYENFSPITLFANNEQGYWLDPGDFNTMFQDSAGTTPVTSVGQSVRLMLDKSKELALGPELVTNGTFNTDLNGWANNSTGTGSIVWNPVGAINLVGTDANNRGRASQIVNCVAGRTYRIQWSAFGASYNITIGTGVASTSIGFFSTGNSAYFTATQNNITITILTVSAGGTVTFDNISVRELPGNHFTQANTANAPILGREPIGGRRNLLTFTEQFDNAVWVKTGTVTLTDQGGGVWRLQASGSWRLAISVPVVSGTTYLQTWTIGNNRVAASQFRFLFNGASAGAIVSASASPVRISDAARMATSTASVTYGLFNDGLGGDVDILISFPQLETGSPATAYQRVGSQFDVTESGVPTVHYLSFDGTDDWLQSAATINPGNIDKVQVFAGVRKLSDATLGSLLEASLGPGQGRWQIQAPGGDASPSYRFVTLGTSVANISTVGFPSPVTSVVAGLSDISAPSAILRVDGTQRNFSTVSQGTGNFLTYTHFIGRRGGTTFPFNGRLYQLITRYGPNLPLVTIQQTEMFTNQRTGAY